MPTKEKRPPRRYHLQTGTELPADYKFHRTFNLEGGPARLAILLFAQIMGFLLFGWLALTLILYLRPTLEEAIVTLGTLPIPFVIGANLVGIVLLYLCHEAVHGLVLYAYTRTRPQIGFQLFYLTLSLPKWYFPRRDLILVALAPLVILSLLGLILLQFIPDQASLALVFGLAMNAAASVGDLILCGWLLRQPGQPLTEYLGDTLNVYR